MASASPGSTSRLWPLGTALVATAVHCSGYELKLPRSSAPAGEAPARVNAAPPLLRTAELPPPRSEAPSREAAKASDLVPKGASPPAMTAAPAATVNETPELPDVPLELVATAREVTVYSEPSRGSQKLGYLRLGARVKRSAKPAGYDGCPKGFYAVA